MPGLTAWAGLHCLAKPRGGETVVISAATGGVGAVAGQLAQARACTVIGIAGSDEKCRQATQSLGYDHCLNRTTQAVGDALRALCPQGIHVYFDLVGGPLLSTASGQLAIGGRVLLCGLMADYNGRERLAGPPPGLWIRARATVFGLVVYDFEARHSEGTLDRHTLGYPVRHGFQQFDGWIVLDIFIRKTEGKLAFVVPFLEIGVVPQDFARSFSRDIRLAYQPVTNFSNCFLIVTGMGFDIASGNI